MSYNDLSEHQWMISDRIRTTAFGEALARTVKPDDTVLDFGCGLGILAMMAARAGARKVYAVDRLPIVRLAQAIAKKNGLDQIDFVYAPGEGFELPEKVDVIVSEWLGQFALQEGMLEALCIARDRHLRPGGRMIPARVTMKAALVRDKSYHEERCYFQTSPYGFDFSPAAELVFAELSSHRFIPAELLSPVATVADLDIATVDGMPRVVEGELVPDCEAEVYGMAGWFESDLCPGVRLDTGPAAPDTHWLPLYFPFAEPWRVDPSRPVRLRFTPVQVDLVSTRWHWWAGDGETERRGDNLTLLAYLRRPLANGLLK